MIGRPRHLHEERLFECYVAERSGDPADPSWVAHLDGCRECRARYAELTLFMDRLREEAEEETDAVFTPQQLRVQQQQILRRLEHLGHPARVISFPVRLMRRHFAASNARIAPRWAVAAAAAGLFVGVGVGVIVNVRSGDTPMAIAASRPVRSAAPVATAPIVPIVDDDAFLSELEAALGGPRNQELLPFDALTPRVQEISSRPLRY
jgi:anti-sigma factor RsiW